MINGTSIFKIINFPNMCSNIPASPAYGVRHNHANNKTLINVNKFCNLRKVLRKLLKTKIKRTF
jgi:hypothetical protein